MQHQGARLKGGRYEGNGEGTQRPRQGPARRWRYEGGGKDNGKGDAKGKGDDKGKGDGKGNGYDMGKSNGQIYFH